MELKCLLLVNCGNWSSDNFLVILFLTLWSFTMPMSPSIKQRFRRTREISGVLFLCGFFPFWNPAPRGPASSLSLNSALSPQLRKLLSLSAPPHFYWGPKTAFRQKASAVSLFSLMKGHDSIKMLEQACFTGSSAYFPLHYSWAVISGGLRDWGLGSDGIAWSLWL